MDISGVSLKGLSFSADDAVYTERDAVLGKVVAAAPVEVGLVEGGKVFCQDCGFWVQPVGHSVRCRVPTMIPADAKTFSWIGDAAWDLLVRYWITKLGADRSTLQGYIGNSSMAHYYDSGHTVIPTVALMVPTSSVHSRGTMVEASYATSAEVRHELLQFFGIDHARFFDSVWSPLLDDTFDTRLDRVVHPAVDGYCYMRLLDSDDALDVAHKLSRYPTVEQLLPYMPEVDVERDWYYLYHRGILHVFDGFHVAARHSFCSFKALIHGPDVRIGGVNYDITELVLFTGIHGSWPPDIVYVHNRLSYLFRYYHFAGAVPFHAMGPDSTYRTMEKFGQEYVLGEPVGRYRKFLLRAVETCDVSARLLHARLKGYIATSGPFNFTQVDCQLPSHVRSDEPVAPEGVGQRVAVTRLEVDGVHRVPTGAETVFEDV